ncbi:transglutaminase domain-containing protein [Marinobacter sp.]|uniref:transglutaminase domain-containing protein n=1 Tax=Marinobacter sp. TaxID=50741 RepID=UPI0038509080
MTALIIDVPDMEPDALLLAPVGITTPYDSVTSVRPEGARIVEVLNEPELGLSALLLEAEGGNVRLTHGVCPAPGTAVYPESVFAPRSNQYTEASPELALASREIASAAGGGAEAIRALVAEAEARFTYAHPEIRFNEGADRVPYLSCGLTPGSCIDIHTYLVASLRAAGFEAGYVYGYFFSRESGGQTDDMHCWAVTRHNGELLEWDVAHHLKAGLGKTRSGLNPRPGHRVAIGHSLGHRYTKGDGGIADLKLLAGPLVQSESGTWNKCRLKVHWMGGQH